MASYITIGDWSFSLYASEDANLAHVDEAIEAWTKFRDMLLSGEVTPIN